MGENAQSEKESLTHCTKYGLLKANDMVIKLITNQSPE